MAPTVTAADRRHDFPLRPVEYAAEVLGITTLTEPQQAILKALHEPPYRVLVPAGHDVGKSFVAAVAASYWYDSFNPGLVLTTAPREADVLQIIWTELRLLRSRAGLPTHDMAPKAAYLGDGPEHYCAGFVSQKGQAFQGRHRPRMLFIFDEANDVQPLHWITARTMADPTLGSAWLAIFNPTSTTSAAYQEDMLADEQDGTPRWTRHRLSALDHPNVLAQLEGGDKQIKGAVSLEMVEEAIRDWCEPVTDPEDVRATDVRWPPKDGAYYRPGPLFQSRVMGLWPDVGEGVWSPSVWEACLSVAADRLPMLYPVADLPEIGCDCATGKGDDYHAIHGRWGKVSWHHETSNTMNPVRICERLKAVAYKAAFLVNRHRNPGNKAIPATDIPIKIDDDGTGGAVGAFLGEAGYTVYMIGAGCSASDDTRYPRRRDELWFQAAERARRGLVQLNLLDRSTRGRLRQQLLAPAWEFDLAGRRVVERKEDTKEKIGRSPDDADALNLAYMGNVVVPPVESVEQERQGFEARLAGDSPFGRLFGR